MTTYQHTQKANAIIIPVTAVAMVTVIIALLSKLYPVLLILPILVLIAWIFRSLTIEITDTELRWSFGPGLIRKSVPTADIVAAEVVRTSTWEGWGIHYSRFGWLYNVSGFGAVAMTLRNGKRFCLGSDKPELLAERLTLQLRPQTRIAGR